MTSQSPCNIPQDSAGCTPTGKGRRPFGVRWQSGATTPLWAERSDRGIPRPPQPKPCKLHRSLAMLLPLLFATGKGRGERSLLSGCSGEGCVHSPGDPSPILQHENIEPRSNCARTRGFTLIELILVMAILTIAVSLAAPTLSHFFAGRALDSEARRLLALTRLGQSRAVAEGLPMELWVDPQSRTYGLEAEVSSRTSADQSDPKAVTYTLDRDVKMEIPARLVTKPAVIRSSLAPISIASVPVVVPRHGNLPTIRFLPDGSVAENSPQMLHLIDRENASLFLALATSRLSYEIRTDVAQ
ncbi:hypothetical protein SBV1_860013 [Verrucomicrobia bacterium]|nr:hypothetical protein SBV1_860013 [Verrucomicrobiota bacterium]